MSGESFYQPLGIINAKASTDLSPADAGKGRGLQVKKRPSRRKKAALGSAREFVEDLFQLYRRECALFCPTVAWLFRETGVPYETLRHFLETPESTLSPENEEKLARGLGRTSCYFRAVVDRWHRFRAWKQKAPAARC